jgi:hypothetical protein
MNSSPIARFAAKRLCGLHYAERLLMPRRRVEGLSRKGSSVADAA